jgi:hypothetical protein
MPLQESCAWSEEIRSKVSDRVCEPVFRVSERERALRATEGGFADASSAQNRPKSGVKMKQEIRLKR